MIGVLHGNWLVWFDVNKLLSHTGSQGRAVSFYSCYHDEDKPGLGRLRYSPMDWDDESKFLFW